MLHNNSFLQLVRKATRIQGKHFSLIDHICVKNDQNPYLTGTLISDISDHFFNFISLSSTKKSTQNSTKGYRLERIINSKTKEKFRDALNEIQWTNVTCQSDVNLAFTEYEYLFISF